MLQTAKEVAHRPGFNDLDRARCSAGSALSASSAARSREPSTTFPSRSSSASARADPATASALRSTTGGRAATSVSATSTPRAPTSRPRSSSPTASATRSSPRTSTSAPPRSPSAKATWLVARTYAERAKDLYEQVGDRANVGRVLNDLGGILFLLGKHDEAIDYLKESVSVLFDAAGDVETGYAVSSLAQVYLRTGDADARREAGSNRPRSARRPRGRPRGDRQRPARPRPRAEPARAARRGRGCVRRRRDIVLDPRVDQPARRRLDGARRARLSPRRLCQCCALYRQGGRSPPGLLLLGRRYPVRKITPLSVLDLPRHERRLPCEGQVRLLRRQVTPRSRGSGFSEADPDPATPLAHLAAAARFAVSELPRRFLRASHSPSYCARLDRCGSRPWCIAAAITGSTPDGDAHPYVGALVVDGSVACSGVLIAPTVFATAGHCGADGTRVEVSLDSKLDDGWTPPAGTLEVDAARRSDLAVVVLDAPAPVAPASLPRPTRWPSLREGASSRASATATRAGPRTAAGSTTAFGASPTRPSSTSPRRC